MRSAAGGSARPRRARNQASRCSFDKLMRRAVRRFVRAEPTLRALPPYLRWPDSGRSRAIARKPERIDQVVDVRAGQIEAPRTDTDVPVALVQRPGEQLRLELPRGLLERA